MSTSPFWSLFFFYCVCCRILHGAGITSDTPELKQKICLLDPTRGSRLQCLIALSLCVLCSVLCFRLTVLHALLLFVVVVIGVYGSSPVPSSLMYSLLINATIFPGPGHLMAAWHGKMWYSKRLLSSRYEERKNSFGHKQIITRKDHDYSLHPFLS